MAAYQSEHVEVVTVVAWGICSGCPACLNPFNTKLHTTDENNESDDATTKIWITMRRKRMTIS